MAKVASELKKKNPSMNFKIFSVPRISSSPILPFSIDQSLQRYILQLQQQQQLASGMASTSHISHSSQLHSATALSSQTQASSSSTFTHFPGSQAATQPRPLSSLTSFSTAIPASMEQGTSFMPATRGLLEPGSIAQSFLARTFPRQSLAALTTATPSTCSVTCQPGSRMSRSGKHFLNLDQFNENFYF